MLVLLVFCGGQTWAWDFLDVKVLEFMNPRQRPSKPGFLQMTFAPNT